MKLFYRLSRASFATFFKFFYNHEVIGLENIPEGGCILAPNHASYWDPPLIGVSCQEEIYYIARNTLFSNRFFAFIIHHLNALPIFGNISDKDVIRQSELLILSGKKVVIFPEGERTESGQLKSLEKGVAFIAQRTQCPIIPIFIAGSFSIWPIMQKYPHLKGHTVCIFGKPIDSKKFSHLSKKEAIMEMTASLEKSLHDLKDQAL